jgi:hypothetical protein
MKLKQLIFWMVVGIALSAISPVIAVPVQTGNYFPNGTPDSGANQYIKIDPGKFYQPGMLGWSFNGENTDIGKTWEFGFWLTKDQNNQLWEMIRLDTGHTLSIFDAFNEIVPEQISILPLDLQEQLKIMQINPVPSKGYGHMQILAKDGSVLQDIWTDPSGTVVPESIVPDVVRQFYPGYSGPTIKGISLMQYGDVTGFTPETAIHLSNLGLSTDCTKTDLDATSSISGNLYSIVLQGTSPDGARMTWTFILGEDNVWRDATTGQLMSTDARYILSGLGYIDPPVTTSVRTAINFTANKVTMSTVQSLTPVVSSVSSHFGKTSSPLTQGSAAIKIPANSMSSTLSSSLNRSPATVSLPSDVFPASQIKNSNKVNSSQRSIVLLKTYTKNFT